MSTERFGELPSGVDLINPFRLYAKLLRCVSNFMLKKAQQKFGAECKMALHPTFCLYEMDPQSIVAVAWLKDFKKTNFKIINEDLFCQFCFGFDYNFEFEPDFKCVLRSNIFLRSLPQVCSLLAWGSN